jgi:hypothetical protein
MANEQDLIASLFTALESTIFYGDRLGQGQMVSMMNPGQFLSQNLKETSPADLFVQFDVTDPGLDTSFIRKPLTSTLSRQYEFIFQAKALPLKQLTHAQQQQLAAAKATVDSLEDAYDQYKDAYDTSYANYQTALNHPDTDPGTLTMLYAAVTRAQRAWEQNGLRKDFDNAYSEMLYLSSGYPVTYFQELDQLRTQFQSASGGLPYYRTLFEPPIAQWAGASWTKALLDTSTVDSSSYSRSTAYSGGIGVGWGMFSFGGSGGHSETYQHDHTDATTLRAEFEYLRVKIARPWLVPDVFGYRFWTWSSSFASSTSYPLLSDGAMPPTGTLPMYPLEMLVVRNVKLTANFSQTDNSVVTSHMQAGMDMGFGPFSISGSYTENSSQVNVSGVQNGATIEIDQPQIIAFLCSMTPQCPNPDPSLPWQVDAVFPQAHIPVYAAQALQRREQFFAGLRASVERAGLSAKTKGGKG